MTNDEVFATIRDLLVSALAIEPETVVPGARIMDDLNAESIDLLDLRFRLERSFGIKITADDLGAAFRGVADASQFRTHFTVGALRDYIVARISQVGN